MIRVSGSWVRIRDRIVTRLEKGVVVITQVRFSSFLVVDDDSLTKGSMLLPSTKINH